MIHVTINGEDKYILGEMGFQGVCIQEADGNHYYDALTSSGVKKEGERIDAIFSNPDHAWKNYFEELLKYLKDQGMPIERIDDRVPKGWVVYWRKKPEPEEILYKQNPSNVAWYYISSRLMCYKISTACPYCGVVK